MPDNNCVDNVFVGVLFLKRAVGKLKYIIWPLLDTVSISGHVFY